MQITIINHTDGMMHVHKTGCRDIKRQTFINGSWTEDVSDGFTKSDVAEATYYDQIMEGSMDTAMAMDEHKFFPCTDGMFIE